MKSGTSWATTTMNDARLRIYLNDHLALTLGEVELARRCAASNQGELGDFLNSIEPELIADRRVIEEMLRRVDGIPNMVKEGLAWLAEKFGRLKLNDGLLEYTPLSRLIELDTLHTAAFARCCFWENLQTARKDDARFSSIDFHAHVQRALSHHRKLQALRKEAAEAAL